MWGATSLSAMDRLLCAVLGALMVGGGVVLERTVPEVWRCEAWPLWVGVLATLVVLPLLEVMRRRYPHTHSTVPAFLVVVGGLTTLALQNYACVVAPLVYFAYALVGLLCVVVWVMIGTWCFFLITVR